MPEHDPIAALGVGLAADHTEKKRTRAKKGAADKAGDEAENEALDAGSTPDEAVALGEVVEGKASDAVAQALDDAIADGAVEGISDAAASIVANEPAPAVPAAPGDDADSVFDRRLKRLTNLVVEAEFEGGTAFGDLRDCMLDLFKHRPQLWSAMKPSDKQDLIRHIEAVAKQVLEKVVLVVAQEDDVSIHATLLSAFNIKGESIEAKIKIDHVDGDGLLDVYRLAGHKVVVIDAASTRFMSARRSHDPGRDQLDMPFASDANPASPPPPPAPAEDDNDLNPDAEDEVGDAIKGATGDDWGVFDTDRKEWLVDENGGDDAWTGNSGDAGRWPYDDAKRLAADFADGGEGVVPRQLGDDPAPAEPLSGNEEGSAEPDDASGA